MTTPENWLLCNRLKAIAGRLAEGDADDDALWLEAEDLLAQADAEEDADIALPILERSLPELQALVDGWDAGTAHLSEWDRAVLKRALKAYRKRLKLMRLDDESTAARNPLSRGGESAIAGIRPPEQYPQEVWDFLVAQGKLRDAGHGLLELTTG